MPCNDDDDDEIQAALPRMKRALNENESPTVLTITA
jgi:hypothetical protein